MDFISKVIGILLFCFPLVLLQSLESDLNEIEQNDKMILNVIESILISDASKQLTHYNDLEYFAALGAQNKGNRFDIFYDSSRNIGNSLSVYDYFIIAPKRKKENVVYLHYDNCKKDAAKVKWSDGIIHQIEFNDEKFEVGYNEAGLVRSLSIHSSESKTIKKQHLLRYTEDEKIESVQTFHLTEESEKLISQTNYQYTENKIEIERSEYSNHNKEDINKHATFVIDDLSQTLITYSTNDKSIIQSVAETVFNEQGQIIRHVQTKPGVGNTSISSYEYNEQGQVLKSSNMVASVDSILSHKESLYKYASNDSTLFAGNCNQQISMIHSVYDEEGNLANTFTEASF